MRLCVCVCVLFATCGKTAFILIKCCMFGSDLLMEVDELACAFFVLSVELAVGSGVRCFVGFDVFRLTTFYQATSAQ